MSWFSGAMPPGSRRRSLRIFWLLVLGALVLHPGMADAGTSNPHQRMVAAGVQLPDGISVSRRRGGDELQFINADGKALH